MDNFKYAPGQPGYGTTGIDGSSGLSGLAVYFTAYDGNGTDTTTIKNKIDNNLILSPVVQTIPGYPTRKYQNGDIFIDINGKAYEIDLANPNRFAYAGYNLSATGLFIPSGIPGDSTRYSNIYPNKIIDTVNSAVQVLDYTASPAIIYGINSKKFARIEYSNTDPDSAGRNPFTLFIGADTTPGAEKAIALVRDIVSNTFRLGNLGDLDALRQTNLIFDVKSLTQNKVNNEFSRLENDGTIITNHEINTNKLMTPVFVPNNPSFNYSSHSAFLATFSWDKQKFFPTLTGSFPKGNLYVSQKQNSYNAQEFNFAHVDASIRPMVFGDIDTVGSIDVSGLVNGIPYEAYITFFDNGWMRNSKVLSVATGINLVITNPPAACQGSSVDLTNGSVTFGSTLGLTYTYWTDSGATSPLSNPSAITTLGTNTYYIKGTQISTGAYDIQPVQTTVNPTPTVGLTSDKQPSNAYCAGVNATFTATGATNYNFRVNGNSKQNSTNPIFIWGIFANGDVVDVIGSTPAGCTAVSPSITQTIYPNPTATITGDSTAPVGSGGHVYTTQGSMSNYIWTITGGTITAGGSTSDNTATVTWTSAGTKHIYVHYNNTNGCLSNTADYPVTVASLPVPVVTGEVAPCLNSIKTYSTAAGNTNYIWNISAGGTIIGGGGTGNNTVTILWTTVGAKTVQVTYTDTYGGTGTSAPLNIDVKALPAPTITGSASVCNGATTSYTTEAGQSAYNWNIVGGTINSGQGTNSVSVTWTTVGAESISVIYTNGNGCTPSGYTSKAITVNALPTPTISGPNNVIVHSTGNVYTTESGQLGYDWTVTGGTITAGGDGNNTVTVTWDNIGTNTVAVNYSSPAGCTGTPATYNVVTNPVTITLSLIQSNISYSDDRPSYTHAWQTCKWTLSFNGVPASTRLSVAVTQIVYGSNYGGGNSIDAHTYVRKNGVSVATITDPHTRLEHYDHWTSYNDPPVTVSNVGGSDTVAADTEWISINADSGMLDGNISATMSFAVTWESGEQVNVAGSPATTYGFYVPCPACTP